MDLALTQFFPLHRLDNGSHFSVYSKNSPDPIYCSGYLNAGRTIGNIRIFMRINALIPNTEMEKVIMLNRLKGGISMRTVSATK